MAWIATALGFAVLFFMPGLLQQFDAPKRVELQVHLKIRRRVHLGERFAAHACNCAQYK